MGTGTADDYASFTDVVEGFHLGTRGRLQSLQGNRIGDVGRVEALALVGSSVDDVRRPIGVV